MKNLTIPALVATVLATSAAWAADAKPTPAPAPAPQSPMATLFAQADANHDGKLDSQEFAEFQRLRDEMMAKHRPQFANLDKNGDGFISPDELRADRMDRMGKGRHGKGMRDGRDGDAPMHDSLFAQADADHNGTLSAEEYQKLIELRQARQARMAAATPDFASLDNNHDGQLDRNELRAGMRAMHDKMKASGAAPTTN